MAAATRPAVPDLLTPVEAAAFLGLSVRELVALARAGQVPSAQIAGVRRFPSRLLGPRDRLVLRCAGAGCDAEWAPAPPPARGDGVAELDAERCPGCGSSAWRVDQVQGGAL